MESTARVSNIIYNCAPRVLTRILKTGFIESIPGKSWSQNWKIGVWPGNVGVYSFSGNMKIFIYRCNVFYPAKWQFQNYLWINFASGYSKSPSSPTPTQYFLNIVGDFTGVWLYCFPIFSIKINFKISCITKHIFLCLALKMKSLYYWYM